MIYIFQGHVPYEGSFNITFLKHKKKFDIDELKKEYIAPTYYFNHEYIYKFIDWLIETKGFVKLIEDDEYVVNITDF